MQPHAESLKRYRILAEAKGRRSSGRFIVEGPRAVRQIADHHPDRLIEIVASKSEPVNIAGCPVRRVSESQFRTMSRSRTPQGILAVVRLPSDFFSEHLPRQAGPRILLLEDIQDPGNVGTLIRTAAAFDFSGILLTDKCADPFSPKTVQSSAGSVLSLWLRRTSRYRTLIDDLKRREYRLISADVRGRSGPRALADSPRLILALSNEASGPSEWLVGASDIRIRIPVSASKAESLNVAASGAICMYLCSTAR